MGNMLITAGTGDGVVSLCCTIRSILGMGKPGKVEGRKEGK